MSSKTPKEGAALLQDYDQNKKKGEPQPLRSSWRSMGESSGISLLTVPVIYLGIVPIILLDLYTTLFQAACFKGYRLERVSREQFILLDRHNLPYLNWLERLNCDYCAYFNGVIAYAREVGGRTEQHFCPIRNATLRRNPHALYKTFIPNGDVAAYESVVDEQLKRRN